MPSLRDIPTLKSAYFCSGKEILQDFLLPSLKLSRSYDRVTSYFTIDALLAVAQGIDHLYECGGQMRLIIGIHDFPVEAAEAVVASENLRQQVTALRKELVGKMARLSDLILKDRIATLAIMIEDSLLQVKVADTVDGKGIIHSKMLLLRDADDCAVAAIGSVNETASGLGSNCENLVVIRSWVDDDAVCMQQDIFDRVWNGTWPELIVQDLTHELAQDIIDGLGVEYIQNVRLRLSQGEPLSAALDMPSYFFVSGAIPALYQHQERAVIDGLSRWPIRVLYADEVGLGKTFEVAATLAFLARFTSVKRMVILAPKSVLSQWQEELQENFGMKAWLYDSGSRVYISPEGAIRHVKNNCPLGPDMPPIALISAQYARGTGDQVDIFSREGAIIPDVLAVDEAHAARVSLDVSQHQKTTRLYRTLAKVARSIPHLILATATPMQKDSIEYHSLLNLLGLPKHWARHKAFQLSLSIASAADAPQTSELAQATTLLMEALTEMRPSPSVLTHEEESLLKALSSAVQPLARAQMASAHWSVFRSLFIKLHPARLLTVRNTRRALAEVGYVFPKRELTAVTLTGHDQVLDFYRRVNRYISYTYLGVEKALYPDRKFSEGFAKSGYQQRTASSLYSCGRSLERRRAKLLTLLKLVNEQSPERWCIASDMEDADEDDAFLSADETMRLEGAVEQADKSQVLLAINSELAELGPLLKRLHDIRTTSGDPKVDTAIELALDHLRNGSQVLAFSRYTDTVDALIEQWMKVADPSVMYGVYTGARSTVTHHGIERKVTKEEIKSLLMTGTLKLMLCSDAASEGLNLQAARVLINVDVPWTPARLEQRIGRVARLGQKAASVEIVNVWYPQSVEELMYTRLSQRLKGYNLAIGEYPELIANAIRVSILEGSDDDSVKLLQEMRKSIQTDALRALWTRTDAFVTSSRAFRQRLLQAVLDRGTCVGEDARGFQLRLADGSVETLTATEGERETISLTSKNVTEHIARLRGFQQAKDADCRPSAFVHGHDVLDPEKLPTALIGATDYSSLGIDYLTDRPKWLPNPSSLSLDYSSDKSVPAPRFWPPTIGDGA